MSGLFKIAVTLMVVVICGALGADISMYPLCKGLQPNTYKSAMSQYPNMKKAFEAVSNASVATWYTDNSENPLTDAQKLLNVCKDNTIPVIIVYGLPKKDCHAGYSNLGSNKNNDDYEKFVTDLANVVRNRPVIYILEPDAVGLVAPGPNGAGCGEKLGYLSNMAKGVEILTADNTNASLYVDVGYWVLKDSGNITTVGQYLKEIGQKGKLTGISINTSNYRKNTELNEYCNAFGAATKNQYKCVFDTSRNYQGPKQGGEWCNSRYAGIGVPPTNDTFNDLVDYYLWLKVPGESDGPCTNEGPDSLKGPKAGEFFEKGFSLMWDRGYFVDQKKMDKFNTYKDDVDAPSSGGTSWVAIVIVCVCCVLLVVVAVVVKRRSDAKKGRMRYANNYQLNQNNANNYL